MPTSPSERPDPDLLPAQVQRREQQARRGKLRHSDALLMGERESATSGVGLGLAAAHG